MKLTWRHLQTGHLRSWLLISVTRGCQVSPTSYVLLPNRQILVVVGIPLTGTQDGETGTEHVKYVRLLRKHGK